MFILEYEKAIVKYFYDSPMHITNVFFGTDDYQFVDGFHSIKKFPYIYLIRNFNTGDGSLVRRLPMYDGSRKTSFMSMSVNYKAYCVWSKTVEIMESFQKMRFYLLDNPKVYVNDFDLGCENLRVPLRYSTFDYREILNATDEKGTVRCFCLEWRSDLYMTEAFTLPTWKQIQVYILPDGKNPGMKVMDEMVE